jgi:nucleoside-diphosphate-sugar epimerase
MPSWAIRLAATLGRTPLAGALGLPPNLRELVAASDGVTYWATDAKARAELGYAPRSLETGLADTFRQTA